MTNTRVFNAVHLVCLLVTSFFAYYLAIWMLNLIDFDKTYATLLVLHTSPRFYLTILLCFGIAFVLDMFIVAAKFNLTTTPSDYLRNLVGKKKAVL